MLSPQFLVIEGLDGSGGTTQVARLADWLRSDRGVEVLCTNEPSNGPVGRFVRRSLNPASSEGRLGDGVLPYLFAADRRDHLDRVVLPALERPNSWVLSDRYYHSSLAYQSLSIGLPAVAQLNAPFRAPDLTVMIDLEPEVCLERIAQRGGVRERFEALDRLRTIRDAYEDVIEHCRTRGETIHRVSGDGDIEAVADRIRDVVSRWMEDRP